RPADERLGRDVTGHETSRRTAEAAVGQERDRLAESRADDRGGDEEHLAHARAAARTLVADHDDVARPDAAAEDARHRILLAPEDAGRAAVLRALVARDLHDAAVGRERSLENHEAADRLDRLLEWQDDVLARRLAHAGGLFGERPAGHRRGVSVCELGV